jgi:hypothetical protein
MSLDVLNVVGRERTRLDETAADLDSEVIERKEKIDAGNLLAYGSVVMFASNLQLHCPDTKIVFDLGVTGRRTVEDG